MAIAVIGGLLSSTLLSLVFMPAVLAVMDDIAGASWGWCGAISARRTSRPVPHVRNEGRPWRLPAVAGRAILLIRRRCQSPRSERKGIIRHHLQTRRRQIPALPGRVLGPRLAAGVPRSIGGS